MNNRHARVMRIPRDKLIYRALAALYHVASDAAHGPVKPTLSHRFVLAFLYAGEMAWREDNRRVANGAQFAMLASAALASGVSRQWKGYWQRAA